MLLDALSVSVGPVAASGMPVDQIDSARSQHYLVLPRSQHAGKKHIAQVCITV